MPKLLLVSYLYLLLSSGVYAQVMPAPNSTVNYRLAGFSVPAKPDIINYRFEIVADSVNDEHAFDNAVIIENSTENKCIIQLPAFGSKYTWRVRYINDYNETALKTPLYHFNTGMVKTTDTAKYRLKVLKKTAHHTDMLVLVDYALAIYDLDGNPLWYMPEIPQVAGKGLQLRDFKPTHDGRFTVVTTIGAFELDYNGKVIWAAPNNGRVSGDSAEYYHHEFTKLRNGHYMVAGGEYIWRKLPAGKDIFVAADDKDVVRKDDGAYYKKILCGTLIEYDAAGNVVWSWKSSQHFTDKDFFRPIKETGHPFNSDTHMNGFEFDEEQNIIYISFRDINRVLKIQYPSGNVTGSYGEIVHADWSIDSHSPFYGQHCCRINKKNNSIYLFNNNTGTSKQAKAGVGSSMVSAYTIKGRNNLVKTGDFSCKPDNLSLPVAASGGSVVALDDDCMLVSMGSANRIFIVNHDKEIIWDALPQVSDAKGVWMPLGPYRVNYIDKKELEKFVFSNQP